MRILYFLPVQVAAQFGLCLYNVTIPEGGSFLCDPPNALPQICNFQCNPGYYRPPTSTLDLTCMNSICTNQCAATQKTCRGAVPVQRTDSTGNPYTDYIQEERACCTLEKPEAPVCELGPCTGSCENPGIYTFNALMCPDVCVPYREPANPVYQCESCKLPELSFGVYTNVTGEPPHQGIAACSPGYWGTPVETACTTTGEWYPPPLLQCTPCSPHEYPLVSVNGDTIVEEGVGSVTLRCGYEFVPAEKVLSCDTATGAWSEWEVPECREPPSILPSVSATPSVSVEPTPSSSKSPRPPKIKGSRAPSPPPKLFGSKPPETRP